MIARTAGVEMKLHDFGLWFFDLFDGEWSTTVPRQGAFYIYYDGLNIGWQTISLYLYIGTNFPNIVKLRGDQLKHYNGGYKMDRPLRLEDLEIVQNPDYKGVV